MCEKSRQAIKVGKDIKGPSKEEPLQEPVSCRFIASRLNILVVLSAHRAITNSAVPCIHCWMKRGALLSSLLSV